MIASRDFVEALKKAREEARQQRPAFTLKMALDTLALIKLRIQGSGQDFEGAPFADYNPIYAKYGREKKGYQSSFVDFTRQGRMWANIVPQVVEATPMKVVVETGAQDDENRAKLAGQVKKRGNILTPSADEVRMVRDANVQRIQNIFKKYFNA